MPKSKLDFWRPKLEGNRLRDGKNRSTLEAEGWTVIEVWECEINSDYLQQLIAVVLASNPSGTARNKIRSRAGEKVVQ